MLAPTLRAQPRPRQKQRRQPTPRPRRQRQPLRRPLTNQTAPAIAKQQHPLVLLLMTNPQGKKEIAHRNKILTKLPTHFLPHSQTDAQLPGRLF
ncbi:hypothetical protein EYC58_02815 [Candidatus Saccharibacteria bacterium]|nr:MAG: hypothetical protein EYC58_02815 [Candidatus Saccharibacteria bacterium]